MSLANIFAVIVIVAFGLLILITSFSFIGYKFRKGGEQEFDYDSLPQKKPSGTVNIHPKRNKAIYTSGILRQKAVTSSTVMPLSDGDNTEVRNTHERTRHRLEVLNPSVGKTKHK